MEQMIFSVTELKNKAVHEVFQFEGVVNVSGLASLPNNDIRKMDPVHVKGFCTVDGEEIIFTFTTWGKMILPCARTLIDVTYSFSIEATEIFSTSGHSDDEDAENGVHQVLEEMLDLTPYIKENILLEMPYRVFSTEKALEQGDGWEFYQEEDHMVEKDKRIDPRLAKLGQLLDQKDNE